MKKVYWCFGWILFLSLGISPIVLEKLGGIYADRYSARMLMLFCAYSVVFACSIYCFMEKGRKYSDDN